MIVEILLHLCEHTVCVLLGYHALTLLCEVTCLHDRENLLHFSRSIVALPSYHLLNIMAFDLIDLPTSITLAKTVLKCCLARYVATLISPIMSV